jgi:hypothetical protein
MTRSSSSLPSAYIFCVWGYFVDVLCQVWKMSSIPSLLRGLWVIWLCQKLFLHLLVWLCAFFLLWSMDVGIAWLIFSFQGFACFYLGSLISFYISIWKFLLALCKFTVSPQPCPVCWWTHQRHSLFLHGVFIPHTSFSFFFGFHLCLHYWSDFTCSIFPNRALSTFWQSSSVPGMKCQHLCHL